MERFKALHKFYIKGSYLVTIGMELAYAEETGILAVLHHGKKFSGVSKQTIADWVARKNIESEGKSSVSIPEPVAKVEDVVTTPESVAVVKEEVPVSNDATIIAEMEAEASQIEIDKAYKGGVKKNTPKDEFKAVVKEAKESV